MQIIFGIVVAVLVVALVWMALLLRFDRRQNRIVDAKLVEQVERAEQLAGELERLRQQSQQQVADIAQQLHAEQVAHALADERNRSLQERLDVVAASEEQKRAELEKLQASFRAEFKNLANDLLEEKQRTLKESNKESLELILKPLRTNIVEFRERVEKIYSEENQQYGSLKNELKNLMELNNQMTTEARNLTRALKGDSKVQGDWGEVILDSLLEHSGLQKGIHYTVQENLKSQEGRNMRPDVVLSLPEGKKIIVDSKVSLTAFVEWTAAEDDDARKSHLAAHLSSVKGHVQELATKRYQDLMACTPEFVIMFVPHEAAFMCALQNAPSLWADAYKKNVVISSPTNLLALLRIVYDLWQRDAQNKNAIKIAEEGGKLYDKVVGFVETLGEVERNIGRASESCSKAMNQLSTGSGNILRRVENLRTLGAKAQKRLPEPLVSDPDEEKDL